MDSVRDLVGILTPTPSPLQIIYAQVAAVYPTDDPPHCSILLPGTSTHVTGIRLTTACKDIAFQDNVAVLMNGTDPIILAVFQTVFTAQSAAGRGHLFSATTSATGWVKVPLDTATFGIFDTTFSRYVAPAAGLYSVKAHARFNLQNNPQVLEIAVRKNGTEIIKGNELDIRGGTAGDEWSCVLADDVNLAFGDYLELWAYNSGGNAVDLEGSSQETYMAVHRISA